MNNLLKINGCYKKVLLLNAVAALLSPLDDPLAFCQMFVVYLIVYCVIFLSRV
jgi:hypothetical protein